MSTVKELIAYKKAFVLAMEIFEVSKKFPKEETYSLTDQIRRSSRSVCINLSEGYRKRLYPAHFTTKLSDADMENSETLGWLEFAFACKYVSEEQNKELSAKAEEVGRLLGYMLAHPEKYLPKK